MTSWGAERAQALDDGDPLAALREEFILSDDVVAYLDGNSLGRPLHATRRRLAEFVTTVWGTRLIRGWDERWMAAPTEVGDQVGRITLGAARGQTVIGDSTSVLLYKLLRAGVAARPGRDVLVIDSGNFPTDRFIAQSVAEECGLKLRAIEPAPHAGPSVADVESVLDQHVALVLLSHVDYRSAEIAALEQITKLVHAAGALVLWDLSHSVGVMPIGLDGAGADLAVGCTYKYLNGGPGSPAFLYVAAALQDQLRQPISGWMGAADPFAMGSAYTPADGVRRFLSGTPPIVGMQALRDMLVLIDRVGLDRIRAKSVALTEFAIQSSDALLAPLGVELASPRDAAQRGGHVMLEHDAFRELTPALWARGVIPDFRQPRGLRLGLSPLSTSFAELHAGISAVAELLAERGHR
ncbi:MAG: kynureninase [Solirubrobacteraceae bacterium]